MAYDQSKLITDVRICLGGISEEKLPDAIILHYGDLYDAIPEYTGDYPYIFWYTTLSCIDYLKAQATTSESSSATSKKEKVGDVQIDMGYASASSIIDNLDDLYQDYLNNPEKFGVILEQVTPPVIINGVYTQEVDNYRENKNTTSIYNPLSVTSFPKCDPFYTNSRRRRRYR